MSKGSNGGDKFWLHMTISFPILVANDNNFSDLFSIVAFWEARKTRRVILYNLREISAGYLNFRWSYGNFNPLLSYLSLGRVRARTKFTHTVIFLTGRELALRARAAAARGIS
jgi:hypothetical protein